MAPRTATYTYQDDETGNEFTVELYYDIHPAEPDVGIMSGGFEVTEIGDVEGWAYFDGHPAELTSSMDSRTGWESVIRHRLMAIYAERGPTADKMEEACAEKEQGEYEAAMDDRAEYERERQREDRQRDAG